MALVIDGVCFQLAQPGAERIWRETLPLLVGRLGMPIVFLDRGGFGEEIAGLEVIPFPSYKPEKYTPHDSALLERVCRHYDAKVFISTCYTSPLQTPSLLLVYDMAAERLGGDSTTRDRREKEVAIAHARRHICISGGTRQDLLAFYPELDPATTTVVDGGVNPEVRWEPFADEVAKCIRALATESEAGAHRRFYEQWARLRQLQGEVDALV